MLNQPYFYHGCVKYVVTTFGALFKDIVVRRQDGNGDKYQQIEVPLSYAPKHRTIARIKQNPNIDERQAQVTVPRMSFEMVQLNYDSARKINMRSGMRGVNSSNNNNIAAQMYSPTPYEIKMNLYIYAKNQDDSLQIIEQILPFFAPDLNVSVTTIEELNHVRDLCINLDSVSYEDDYEGDLDTRRTIIWTLSFTVKMDFYGPITHSGVIKKITVNLDYTDNGVRDPSSKFTAEVVPYSATPMDEYQITENFLYSTS